MNSITQDMKYRQSMISHAERHGVMATSVKYNKARSFIYFWLGRYDGTIESLAKRSRRPHSHPNAHTPQELKLIADMRRRNPDLGLNELWYRLRNRGYTRTIESLYRALRRMTLIPQKKSKPPYKPKPYEQMSFPGERIQIDVKRVPTRCIVGHAKGEPLYQYTAIDEFSRFRFIQAFKEQSTFSSHQFLLNTVSFFQRHGVSISCVQTDNGFEFTNRFVSTKKTGSPTLFEQTASALGIRHKLIRPYTPRHNGKVERSHREDEKRFYRSHAFFSFQDFQKQLVAYNIRSNNIPMRPLKWLSPRHALFLFHRVQHV